MKKIQERIDYHKRELEKLEKMANFTTIKEICKRDYLAQVAFCMGINKDILTSRRGESYIIDFKRIAIRILREQFELSYTSIGKMMGNRGHDTMIWHFKKHEDLMDVDPDYRKFYENTLTKINNLFL